MEILSEMSNGMCDKWVLVKYENNFYAYGTEQFLYDLFGFPVDQCGSKEKIINHCISISDLCKQNIEKYNKEFIKEENNFDGWKFLIEHEQKELEILTEFIKILSQ